MSDADRFASSRREFLTGRAVQKEVERAGDALADQIVASTPQAPTSGGTVRLGTRAMACDFAVVLNPGPAEQVWHASDALELVHQLEDQMSIYRAHSELSRLNARAAGGPVEAEPRLFDLLVQACEIARATGGTFDPTTGQLVFLWRRCKQEGRVPTGAEIAECLATRGVEHIEFNHERHTVRFHREGTTLDLGGIGKGHALDRAGEVLNAQGLDSWLLHGGHSSILARGDHNAVGGWPVGLRNPLFPGEQLCTVVLRDQALSSSGSGVQYFRFEGRRYGHILDPRTGWPVEGMLSATVIAPTAAEADALSTAFFVMGLEKAWEYCDNSDGIGAILIPPPRGGRKLEPVVRGIPDDVLFFTPGITPADIA